MKTLIIITTAVALIATLAWADPTPSPTPSPATSPAPAAQKYTCPMHPEVVSDQPGKCPKCGMKLIPKK